MNDRPNDLKEAADEIQEIRNLVVQTEKVVSAIERLLPAEESSPEVWLSWRHRTLKRRLTDAKRDLFHLTNAVQGRLADHMMDRKGSRKVR